MIVVIADDMSGAAEVAGIAHDHGLRAVVQTVFDAQVDADVIAVDTDTRSSPADVAAGRVAAVTAAAARRRPGLIYKKVDSLMRGPIAAELRAMMTALDVQRVLLVPANPSRGRTIRDGRYAIAGTPLHHTRAAHDPEWPAKTDEVVAMLGSEGVGGVDVDGVLPTQGIYIADVQRHEHLVRWSEYDGQDVLLAGAADFFDALLDRRLDPSQRRPLSRSLLPVPRTLLVCGSAAAWQAGREDDCLTRGVPVLPMPDALLQPQIEPGVLERWAADGAGLMQRVPAVMLAIGRLERLAAPQPHVLAQRLSAAAAKLVQGASPSRVMIEGGATASALLRCLGCDCMRVSASLAPGVVELSDAQGRRFLIKPGSYAWPPDAWESMHLPAGRGQPLPPLAV